MPNYTYEAVRASEHSYIGGVTPLTLSTVDPSGPKPFRGDCEDHGIHTALERDEEIVIDREDDTWRLPDEYAVSYCETCLDEYRREARLLEADSVEEAVSQEDHLVDDLCGLIEVNWRHLRTPFRPDDPSSLERVPVGDGEAGGEA